MPVTTRGQEEFEAYLQSDEVKQNKQKIQEAVRTHSAFHVFTTFSIWSAWLKDTKRCRIYLAGSPGIIIELGDFAYAKQIETMYTMYCDVLREALNGRVAGVTVS